MNSSTARMLRGVLMGKRSWVRMALTALWEKAAVTGMDCCCEMPVFRGAKVPRVGGMTGWAPGRLSRRRLR